MTALKTRNKDTGSKRVKERASRDWRPVLWGNWNKDSKEKKKKFEDFCEHYFTVFVSKAEMCDFFKLEFKKRMAGSSNTICHCFQWWLSEIDRWLCVVVVAGYKN